MGNERSRAASFASAFAAREAFAKASGVSMYTLALNSRFSLDRTDAGPRLVVPPELDPSYSRGEKQAWVSISHDGDYVAVIVVIEGR
jgi:phosphopantetheine--protein transferase-like protein